MRTQIMLAALLAAIALPASSQWTIQDSHTTASLRGIHYVGKGVAWASGTNGTVLRTLDMGKTWTQCAMPPEAEKLDFRGVQAFDAQTAIVMFSGKGDLSRLYKTVDGCKTWKLVFTNPDKEGFWDAIAAESIEHAIVLGDSVDSKIRIWEWEAGEENGLLYGTDLKAHPGESSFAASNSVLQEAKFLQMEKHWKYELRWASKTGEHAYINYIRTESGICEPCRQETKAIEVPMEGGSASAGIFSFAFRDELTGVAVGGDYQRPAFTSKTASYTTDGGQVWRSSGTTPGGYRSAVVYDAPKQTWIAVGPNGTDISRDDGRNWYALKPTTADTPDANKNWNALSLPFVVGSMGRIGILREDAVKQP